MKIERALNNNTVITKNEVGKEIIFMGKGIGFEKKKGDELDLSKVEKIFRQESNQEFGVLKELLIDTPLEQVDVADNVVRYAKRMLNNSLEKDIYVLITSFIKNYEKEEVSNIPLITHSTNEIQTFFKVEYMIGEFAREEMRQLLNKKVEDEFVTYIALYIVCAEYGIKLQDAINMVNLINNMLKIIERNFPGRIQRDGVRYESCVAHIRYLAKEIIRKEHKGNQLANKKLLIDEYKQEYECGNQIKNYIKAEYDYEIMDEDLLYLLIHIRLITIQKER